jgi:Cu/Ag efflux protein CusF
MLLTENMQTKDVVIILFALVILFSVACKPSQSTTTAPAPSPTPPNLKPIALPPPAVIGKPYPGKGVIKLINRKENWIEIDHEEIVDLMPAMEMEWSPQKPSLLNGLKVGDKVTFVVVETGKGEVITEIKKIKE